MTVNSNVAELIPDEVRPGSSDPVLAVLPNISNSSAADEPSAGVRLSLVELSHSDDLPSTGVPPLISALSDGVIESRRYAVAKRAFDVGVSLLLLAATMPLLLIMATLVKLTSPGPIVFGQPRCGKGGTIFTCYKFRTMFVDAEERKADLVSLNEMTGPVFKMRRDPRVTAVGRWLRRLSIDELPQLWNVLRGEMTLVGPRPPLPEEVASYEPHHLGRLAVTPGITCLWQVSGRNQIGFEEWVELDLEYIRRRSFWYDVGLVLRTIPAVLGGKGAS